uniref:Fibronectin type-III domain-containing protein n=1 Tax=Amphimedon queenslandica TaxID=400682 RepID=A0A1X7T2D9_AMPQE
MSLLVVVAFFLSVREVTSKCPPSSGIYLMYNGDCYPNGSYFYDDDIRPEQLKCTLPGFTLNGGEWVTPDGSSVCCSTDPLRCDVVSAPNATISLYIPTGQGISSSDDGWYKCCLPTSCSNPSTNIIFANIFRWGQIEDTTVDLPSDVTVLPQTYTLHAIKIGHQNQLNTNYADWYYNESSGTSTKLCRGYNDEYSCSRGNGMKVNYGNGRYDYTLTLTWNEENITSGVSNNYHNHVYIFHLEVGLVTRYRYITVKVPATAPSSLTVVNKTATTITVSWTTLDSSDADGYVVNVTDSDTVQTVQVEGNSINTVTLNGLRGGTTYSITVRAYKELLGPASSAISVFIQCHEEGIYLQYNEICYSNKSYFWDSSVNAVTEAISCVLPGTSLTTGQWVRVDDPDHPVDCNSNSDCDPFHCTSVTSPNATLNLYLAQGLSAEQEGWYKCCLPTDCSDPNTNIIFANIFRFAEIESFTVADFPSDMTVYPQEYKLNCVKIGFYLYGIRMSINSIALVNYANCDDRFNNYCSGTALVSSTNTIRYTVAITWNGMTVSNGSISQSTTGDQMYQC